MSDLNKLDDIIRKWLKVADGSTPCDLERAYHFICELYIQSGFERPAPIPCPSPASMFSRIATLPSNMRHRPITRELVAHRNHLLSTSQILKNAQERVGRHLDYYRGSAGVSSTVSWSTNSSHLSDPYSVYVSRWCNRSGWIGDKYRCVKSSSFDYVILSDWLRTHHNNLMIDHLVLWSEISYCCGWWMPYEDMVFMCQRPSRRTFDARNFLHNDKGHAISWEDGWGLSIYHGVDIPDDWIRGKLPPPSEALRWQNIEQRRVLCELIGWDKILEHADCTVIDHDDDPAIGTLIAIQVPVPESALSTLMWNIDVHINYGSATIIELLLKVRCGTGRVFYLPVPSTVRTALEANAWTYGLDPTSFNPEVRT